MTKEQLEVLAIAVRRVIERAKAHVEPLSTLDVLEMLEQEFRTIHEITPAPAQG